MVNFWLMVKGQGAGVLRPDKWFSSRLLNRSKILTSSGFGFVVTYYIMWCGFLNKGTES